MGTGVTASQLPTDALCHGKGLQLHQNLSPMFLHFTVTKVQGHQAAPPHSKISPRSQGTLWFGGPLDA